MNDSKFCHHFRICELYISYRFVFIVQVSLLIRFDFRSLKIFSRGFSRRYFYPFVKNVDGDFETRSFDFLALVGCTVSAPFHDHFRTHAEGRAILVRASWIFFDILQRPRATRKALWSSYRVK